MVSSPSLPKCLMPCSPSLPITHSPLVWHLAGSGAFCVAAAQDQRRPAGRECGKARRSKPVRSLAISGRNQAAQCRLQFASRDWLFQPGRRSENLIDPVRFGRIAGDDEKWNFPAAQLSRKLGAVSILKRDVKDRDIGSMET